ncbi:MAG: Segregation and condensation protein B [Parcubacteria group bacterium GW2011_GWA2_44_15]|nr:MAG: Segregation and condensation protein B [Parcubacteria group bacterium GW2011_GWA2_44_15]
MTLDAKIEAVLFWKAEPVELSRLGKIFKASDEEIKKALATLEDKLRERGVSIVYKDDEVALRSAPAASGFIETLIKEELTRDLGKAGLETLSIILYQGPVSRRQIDYIRGVNSTFILRNLLVRGLVEKIENPKDQRSFLYRPTFDLLSYLGISQISDLPEYASVRQEIETFTKSPIENGPQNENLPEESAESEEFTEL